MGMPMTSFLCSSVAVAGAVDVADSRALARVKTWFTH